MKGYKELTEIKNSYGGEVKGGGGGGGGRVRAWLEKNSCKTRVK